MSGDLQSNYVEKNLNKQKPGKNCVGVICWMFTQLPSVECPELTKQRKQFQLVF